MVSLLHRVVALASLSVAACSFGSNEVPGSGGMHGGDSTTSAGTNQSASDATFGAAASSSGTDGPVAGTLTAPTSNGDSDGGATEDTGEAESSSGEPADVCRSEPLMFFSQVVLASDSVVIDPMQKWTAPVMGGECVASETTSAGMANFIFSAPCDDEYFVWAHVWDAAPGDIISLDEPDSYAVSVDGGDPIEWTYGCQTFGRTGWNWLAAQQTVVCLGAERFRFTSKAGNHTINFRNLEAGTFSKLTPPGEVAAIARILVTNDPSYVPGAAD